MSEISKPLTEREIQCYESLPLPICIFQQQEGRYQLLLVSDGLCAMLHTTRAEFVSRRREDPDRFTHPDDRKAISDARTFVQLHPEESYGTICRLKTGAGGTGDDVWVACRGKVRRVAGEDLLFVQYTDITDHEALHRAIEEEKRRSESLLDKVLSTTQTAIFWKDTERRFLGVNRAFLDYYGFADDTELLGKNDEEMGWHTDPDVYKNDELRVLETGESTYRVHGKCIARGQERDIVASKSPLYIDGRIAGLVGSFEDVTTEYRQSAQIAALNEELERRLAAEQTLKKKALAANEAKTEFLSRVSHDMRTPLNVILGMSHIAAGQQDPAVMRDCLTKIDTSSKFLLGLINDVLDMAQVEQGRIRLHPAPYPMEEFSGYLDAVIRPLCDGKELRFVLDARPLAGKAPLIDALRANQILFNLLSNAVKFTPAGGTVTLRLRTRRAGADRLALRVVVGDTGIGMSAAFQQHLFEPFTQEYRDDVSLGRGTGLGLAVTKKLVDLMGGTIRIRSASGRGTTVTLCGIFACVPAGTPAAAPAAGDDGILAGRRVLLCEDHPLNQEIACAMLSAKKLLVDTAENGQQGVELFARSPAGFYQAVLMDLRMPVMDGYAATAAIRALDRADAKTVPILAMTADTFAEDVQKCLASGMDGHISKPVDPAALYELLKKFFAGQALTANGKNPDAGKTAGR